MPADGERQVDPCQRYLIELVECARGWVSAVSLPRPTTGSPGGPAEARPRTSPILVTRIFASWNHTTAWLRAVDSLRCVHETVSGLRADS